MAISKSKYYNNPLGDMTEEDLIEIKKNGNVEEFLRNLRITQTPCPPKKLKHPTLLCFECVQCYNHAFDSIKIRKGVRHNS